MKPTDKPVESITKCCFTRGGKQQQQQPSAKRTGTFRGQPSTRPASSNTMVPCSNCGTLIPKTDTQLVNQLASIVTDWVIFGLCADLLITVLVLLKTQGSSTGFVVEAEHLEVEDLLPRRQVNEATEISEAKSNDKSDLDIVRLMEAYGLSNNSPQTSLKQRVQVDDIITAGVQDDVGFENIVNATTKEFIMPVPVLHGVPTEYNTCTEWDAVDELEPIPSYIGQQCIQVEANIPRLEHRCSTARDNAKDNTSH